MKINMKRIFGIVMFFILLSGILWEQNSLRNISILQQTDATLPPKENANMQKRVAYLTFDDGPSKLTNEYLDILEKEGVNATFFLIGEQIDEEMEEVVKRSIKNGNEIGIHTYCHKADTIYQSEDTCYEDIMTVKKLIKDKFDYETKLYRFPWGSVNCYVKYFKSDLAKRLRDEGIEYADWNVSGEDSVGYPSVSSIMSNIRKDYDKYNEPVILLHDSASNKATLQALESVIKELKEKGYSFDILSNRSKTCHFGEYPL